VLCESDQCALLCLQVNDVVVASNDTLVSCSSDTTLKTWRAYANDGECTRTFRQHSDYVTSLASAHQVGHCISLFGCVGTWVTLPITQHGLIGVSQTSS
jgi:WD40 repeat protein